MLTTSFGLRLNFGLFQLIDFSITCIWHHMWLNFEPTICLTFSKLRRNVTESLPTTWVVSSTVEWCTQNIRRIYFDIMFVNISTYGVENKTE